MKHRTNIPRTAGAFGFLMIGVALLPLIGLIMGCKPSSASSSKQGTPNSAVAPTNGTIMARARTATVAPSVKAPEPGASVPRSTFVVPRKVTEGKDPFFPNSTRVYATGNPAPSNSTPSMVTADLTLRGISGTPDHPLAIVNTTTFTTGETNEVLIKNGRLRVQCLMINMATGTVLLQIGAERRELRLASLK